MSTVAESLVAALSAAGVRRIYGIVGDSLNGITDEIRRQKTIEWVHVRHEEVAAFAAGADAHVTGELAVCGGGWVPATFTLSMGSSIAIEALCRFSQSRRIFQAPRSAPIISRRRTQSFCSRDAAITASW